MKKHIPNLFTAANLLSGCLGIQFTFTGHLDWATYAILASLVFDYLDGFMARLLKAQSPIGKELDSLADLVTFGVLPGFIAYHLLLGLDAGYMAFSGLLIPVFSAFRLANFNVDERQATSFIGVPTPANAVFWASLPLIIAGDYIPEMAMPLGPWFNQVPVIVAFIVLTSYLLVSPIPLFSLKMKNTRWKGNESQFIFIGLTVFMAMFLVFAAVPFIVLLYVGMSLVKMRLDKQ